MTNLLLLFDEGTKGIILVMLLYCIVIGLYIWLCYEVGKYAERRGRSYWLFFFISLILNPIIGYIIAALIGESDEIHAEQIRREVKNALEQERNNHPQATQEPEE